MRTISDDEAGLLTCEQVATMYNVNVETVRRWVRKGVIGIVRVGPFGTIRITKAEAARHFVEVAGART